MSKRNSAETPNLAIAICGYGLQYDETGTSYLPDPNMATRLWVGESIAQNLEKMSNDTVPRIVCGGDVFGVGPIAEHYKRFMIKSLAVPERKILTVDDSFDTVDDIDGALKIRPNLVVISNSWHDVAWILARQRRIEFVGVEDYIDTQFNDPGKEILTGMIDAPPTNLMGRATQLFGSLAISLGAEKMYQWTAAKTRPSRAQISPYQYYQLPNPL